MHVNLESTDKVVTLVINGVDVPARIWEGRTGTGVRVHAYITRVAVADTEDTSQFERELVAHRPPTAEVDAIPLRLIL